MRFQTMSTRLESGEYAGQCIGSIPREVGAVIVLPPVGPKPHLASMLPKNSGVASLEFEARIKTITLRV